MEAVFRVVIGLLFSAEWLDIVRQRLDYCKTAVGVFFCLFAAGGGYVACFRLNTSLTRSVPPYSPSMVHETGSSSSAVTFRCDVRK